jgi:hypothetical protein
MGMSINIGLVEKGKHRGLASTLRSVADMLEETEQKIDLTLKVQFIQSEAKKQ